MIGRRSAASVDRGEGWQGLVGFAAGSVRTQTGDRLEQALAVPESDAELLEVGVGQLRQHVRVDLVVAEMRLVLAESEAS